MMVHSHMYFMIYYVNMKENKATSSPFPCPWVVIHIAKKRHTFKMPSSHTVGTLQTSARLQAEKEALTVQRDVRNWECSA